MDCRTAGFPVLYCLLEFSQIHMHLILCSRLLLLPSIFPSIRVFSNESVIHIRWSKYWSFSFSISPSNECSGLISFRIDFFDLLEVQGTVMRLLHHHNLKASILQHPAFLQANSHIRIWLLEKNKTKQNTIALTMHTFLSKMMSLFFDILSRFVIAFLLRRKHLLISWL